MDFPLFLGSDEMTPAEQRRRAQLLALGANMMAAASPSSDPRSKSLAWAMSQGLQGMLGAEKDFDHAARSQQYMDLMQQSIAQKAMRRNPAQAGEPSVMARSRQATHADIAAAIQNMTNNGDVEGLTQLMKYLQAGIPGYMNGMY